MKNEKEEVDGSVLVKHWLHTGIWVPENLHKECAQGVMILLGRELWKQKAKKVFPEQAGTR